MNLIPKALILAGLILAFSFASTLAARSDWIETNTMLRSQGVMAGMVLVLIANLVPKTVESRSANRCDRTRAQAVQRFAGWTLVLAGLGHSLAWIVVPIDRASPVAMSIVAAGLVLVLARVAWAYTSGAGAEPPAEPGS